jgi:cytochrome c55X
MVAMVRGASPAFFLGGLMLLSLPIHAQDAVSRERQAELVRLVRNDCGSCHGLTLAGGLGPALLPASLQGKSPEVLRETVLRGRAGTAMPPWEKFLSEAEADWIVAQLVKGFPDAH